MKRHLKPDAIKGSHAKNFLDLSGKCVGRLIKYIGIEDIDLARSYLKWADPIVMDTLVVSSYTSYFRDTTITLDSLLHHKYAPVFINIERVLHDYTDASFALLFDRKNNNIEVRVN